MVILFFTICLQSVSFAQDLDWNEVKEKIDEGLNLKKQQKEDLNNFEKNIREGNERNAAERERILMRESEYNARYESDRQEFMRCNENIRKAAEKMRENMSSLMQKLRNDSRSRTDKFREVANKRRESVLKVNKDIHEATIKKIIEECEAIIKEAQNALKEVDNKEHEKNKNNKEGNNDKIENNSAQPQESEMISSDRTIPSSKSTPPVNVSQPQAYNTQIAIKEMTLEDVQAHLAKTNKDAAEIFAKMSPDEQANYVKFAKGIVNGALNLGTELIDMVLHPIDTAKGIADAVIHPIQTITAIKDDVMSKLETYEGCGEIAFDFATIFLAVTKSSKVLSVVKKVNKKQIANISTTSNGFKGSRGFELYNSPPQPVRNTATIIGNRKYTGHALDRMQNRGIMPSVIEETIGVGQKSKGNTPGTVKHYDSKNKISVILNKKGDVITVY
jgi:hypothetical protein